MHRFHIHRFNQPENENIWGKKNSRKFQKAKLNLPHTSNYLYRIYIVFTTIYMAFTLY